jgi:hypothetical protein
VPTRRSTRTPPGLRGGLLPVPPPPTRRPLRHTGGTATPRGPVGRRATAAPLPPIVGMGHRRGRGPGWLVRQAYADDAVAGGLEQVAGSVLCSRCPCLSAGGRADPWSRRLRPFGLLCGALGNLHVRCLRRRYRDRLHRRYGATEGACPRPGHRHRRGHGARSAAYPAEAFGARCKPPDQIPGLAAVDVEAVTR